MINHLSVNSSCLLVPETDTTYDMTVPDFQSSEYDLITDNAAIPADGTVLYLNQLLLDDQSSVLIKSNADDIIHLVVDSPLIAFSMVQAELYEGSSLEASHHYYEFPNDLKVYSEHSLQLVFLDG